MISPSACQQRGNVGIAVLFAVWAIAGVMAGPAPCASPCYVVKDYWPIKSCKPECDARICNRGWGAWGNDETCCAPGVAFPEGCGKRFPECWVVENTQLRTCIRDDRKCLQGYGVWPSQAACCAANAAFPEGCRATVPKSPKPCWVVDTYFPARLCRQSDTLCTPEAGVQSWPTQGACCAPGAAFGEGCSPSAPQAPCWLVDSYWPVRKCRQEVDIAACSRGWGIYQTKDVCCAPNVAFPEGCSPDDAPAPATGNLTSVPAKNAVIQSSVALNAPATTVPGVQAGAQPATAVPAAPLPAAILVDSGNTSASSNTSSVLPAPAQLPVRAASGQP